MPKDREPMKSFLLVRSQSQISTDNLLSLSASFSWLQAQRDTGWFYLAAPHRGRDGPQGLPSSPVLNFPALSRARVLLCHRTNRIISQLNQLNASE